MKRIAIVPARAGSKRIPRKNIKEFLGVPIISRVIQTLLGSDLFDRVIVSSDSSVIKEISKAAGAEAPFVRPSALADDHTGLMPVIKHAIDELEVEAAAVWCVLPTSVLICRNILGFINQVSSKDLSKFTVTVGQHQKQIQRSLVVRNENLEMLNPEFYSVRSQDLPATFYDAGSVYVAEASVWRKADSVFERPVKGVLLPDEFVQDIDTVSDWVQAEQKFRSMSDRSDIVTILREV